MPNIKRGMMGAAGVSGDIGKLYTWGHNSYGQLGDGTTSDSSSPTQVGALKDWASIYFISNAAIAMKTNGTLWTWGRGDGGVLGDGTTTSRSSPAQVGSLTNWSSGGGGTPEPHEGQAWFLAIKSDGTLWAWGRGNEGQLGDDSTISKSSPVQVGSLTNWASVNGGRMSSYGVTTSGTLFSWGDGASGVLGNGTATQISSPVQVGSLTNWASTSGGHYTCLALKTDGTIWGWGYGPYYMYGGSAYAGEIISSPVQIGSETTWASLSMTYRSALAIRTDGTLWAWGYNTQGELGTGNTTQYWADNIQQVGSLTNWSSVSAGKFYTVALKTDGTIWAWGRNDEGQLGDGTTTDTSSPIQVGSLTSWSNKLSVLALTNSNAGITEE